MTKFWALLLQLFLFVLPLGLDTLGAFLLIGLGIWLLIS
jgi:hypothetical protein